MADGVTGNRTMLEVKYHFGAAVFEACARHINVAALEVLVGWRILEMAVVVFALAARLANSGDIISLLPYALLVVRALVPHCKLSF